MYVIGITGTNGKTTVSYLVNEVLKAANIKSFILGTLNSRNTDLSTPEAVDIKNCMQKHLQNGGTHFVLEVTSEGIAMSRIKDVNFNIKLLTNISRDHLDFHKSLDSYRETKFKFMRNGGGHKIYPIDFIKEEVIFPTKLLGFFNILNMKAAISILKHIGVSNLLLNKTLSTLPPPPGRLESVEVGQDFKVYIDYAHTPAAIEVVLEALKDLAIYQRGKLLVLFGCGGNRDTGKRKLMGKIASSISDFIIFTDDNPRYENSIKIIDDIKSGVKYGFINHITIQDRKEAIKYIVAKAQINDVVALLGKGHEKYQIIEDIKSNHDDKQIVKEEILNHIKS